MHPDPRDSAAAWFAYLHSGETTEEGLRAFERWRSAHAEHDRQFRAVQQVWDATLEIPMHELRGILAAKPPPSDFLRGRRRFAFGMAGAFSMALAGGLALRQAPLESPEHTLEVRSRRGERRQASLSDGTVLDLNTGSLARVRMYERQRVVDLLEGEIFFAVQDDAQRPFIVNAGDSRIVAGATAFNVRCGPDRVRVSVKSGSLSVERGPWWRSESRSLQQGQALKVCADEHLGEARRADLDKQLAWQRGKIVFENTPLAKAVAEINRYLEQPARLEAPALYNYRIAGIFSVDDPYALIESLPDFAPVRVVTQGGHVRIVAA